VEKADSTSRSPKRDVRRDHHPNGNARKHETSEERINRVQLKAQKELNSLFDDDSEPESPRNAKNLDVVPEK